jgi:hypothetical protein
VSVSACTAVGSDGSGSGGGQTLIEMWDGTSWSVVSSPTTSFSAALDAVSCVSASACTAVGVTNVDGATGTRVDVWDGTSWSVVSSPNVGNDLNQLNGVSCVTVSACTAVGFWANRSTKGPGAFKTLVERWDGTSWSVVSSPNPSTVDSRFWGVSCVSVSACTAVGSYTKSSGSRTLVENWNGRGWSTKFSPNVGTLGSFSFGVSCTTSISCTSVGSYFGGSGSQTLIEMSAPPFAAVTPSSGPSGTSVALTGGGFRAGETVTFTYFTRLASPTSILLCSATADTYGLVGCSAAIPLTNSGPSGSHRIGARGLTSHVMAKTTFILT